MGLRLAAAKTISAVSTWGLKHIFKRPAANFPGKIALYVDPHLIADLSKKLQSGSVVVCGTNGKTTVTNLLADVLEASGKRVVCNRTGANLDSGIATALLHADDADWGVFESDELWLIKVLPHLKSDYVILLNLFRDQLDRVGEIDVIQNSISAALEKSPHTTLVYNADDPFCAAIAKKVDNASLAFGLSEPLSSQKNEAHTIEEIQMCPQCSGMLEYAYHLYGQLGDYRCPQCSFRRETLNFSAQEVLSDLVSTRFKVLDPKGVAYSFEASFRGVYMVYNILATYAAAHLLGCSAEVFQKTLKVFDPQNGRLQQFVIENHPVLLNLAKNPTGFNQNVALLMQDKGPKVIAFFVNDKEGDGRDISWLWDIDFEDIATDEPLRIFAGGLRKYDVQLRLKYAGLKAEVIEGVDDIFEQSRELSSDYHFYIIANYTALPPVREALLRWAKAQGAASSTEKAEPAAISKQAEGKQG